MQTYVPQVAVVEIDWLAPYARDRRDSISTIPLLRCCQRSSSGEETTCRSPLSNDEHPFALGSSFSPERPSTYALAFCMRGASGRRTSSAALSIRPAQRWTDSTKGGFI